MKLRFVIFLIGISYFLSGCGALVETDPPSLNHYNRGLQHYKKGRLDKAVKEYQTAIRLAQNGWDGGAFYIEETYSAVFALSVKYMADMHYHLGRAYEDQGKLDEAIAEYKEAISIAPVYIKTMTSDSKTDEPIMTVLTQLLSDRNTDRDLRIEVIETLGEIGDPAAVPALINTLSDEEGYVRLRAADALMKIDDSKRTLVTPALTQILSDRNKDRDLRIEVIETLGEIGDPAAVPALINALSDEEGFVRLRAAVALIKVDGSNRSMVTPVLTQLLSDRNKNLAFRRGVIRTLGEIGDPATIPALIKTLRSEGRLFRSEIVDALGQIGDPAAVPSLIEVLSDERWSMRRSAAYWLGEIGELAKEAVPALINALSDEEGYVRLHAAEALMKIDSSKRTMVASVLIQLLSDERWSMRRSAAYQLGEIGELAKEAVPAMTNALSDEEGYVRVRAAEALMKIDGSKGTLVIPVLIQLLSDENQEIRSMAVDALKKIGTPEAKKAVEEFEGTGK